MIEHNYITLPFDYLLRNTYPSGHLLKKDTTYKIHRKLGGIIIYKQNGYVDNEELLEHITILRYDYFNIFIKDIKEKVRNYIISEILL